jgi:serine/threonine-protein kinase
VYREVGRGAQGIVYHATDRVLCADVALKVLKPELADDEHLVERMRREALLTRRVVHPGICRVHDLVAGDDATFLVMDFVDGPSLADMLASGPLEPREAVRAVIEVGRAVAAAHAAGVVHRDLKPHNIIVTHEGKVVVVDFGVATAQDLPKLTMTDAVVGTRAYIAPEIWLGAPATALADVYALGVILYEALTGTVPYGDVDGSAVTAAVPPSERRPIIERALDDVTLRAMAPQPKDRFQSMRAFVAALERPSLPDTLPLPLAPRAPRRTLRAAAVASFAVVAVAVAIRASTTPPDPLVSSAHAAPSSTPSNPSSTTPSNLSSTPSSPSSTPSSSPSSTPSSPSSTPNGDVRATSSAGHELAAAKKSALTHVNAARARAHLVARDVPDVDAALVAIRAAHSAVAVELAVQKADGALAGFSPTSSFLDHKLQRLNAAWSGLDPASPKRGAVQSALTRASDQIGRSDYVDANQSLSDGFHAVGVE